MGWILLGIVGAVIGFGIAMVLVVKWEWDFEKSVVFFVLIPILAGLFISFYGNNDNYNEKTVVLTEPLIALSDGVASSGGGLFYISISANNMFTYYTEVETEYTTEDTNSYVSKTVPGSLTVIVEEKNNTEPRLVVYEQTGKKSFWYFNTPPTVTEYVFYVPEGTIQRNMTLN